MRNSKLDVVIIGGGVIGVCTAYYLSRMGREVTILEQAEIGSGSSFGNTGLIVPGHSIPFAHPGMLGKGLKWMLRGDSPFYIKPRLNRDLLVWLWKFQGASNEQQMRKGLRSLAELGYASLRLLERLVVEEGLVCDYHQNGWLMAYSTKEGLREATKEARLLGEYGVETKALGKEELLRKEPALRPNLAGGILFPNEAYLNPAQFVDSLAERVEQRGVTIVTGARVEKIETSKGKETIVRTSGGEFEAEQVVLAAGAWTPKLTRSLGLRLPVEAAKGYSLTMPSMKNSLNLPVYLSEAKVAATPLKEGLRLAGTLELAGMDFGIKQRRVDGILKSAREYLELTDEVSQIDPWMGLRPCTPDGLPIIGRAAGFKNLFIATGHCMLGMTLGPVTGKLMAQLVCGDKPDIGLEPFRLERW